MMQSAWRAAENQQNAVVKPLRTRLPTALAASHDAENEEDACAEFKDIKLKVSLIRYRESYVDWLDKANASEKEYLALLLACKRKNDKVNPQLETLLRRALGPDSLDPSLNLKMRRQCFGMDVHLLVLAPQAKQVSFLFLLDKRRTIIANRLCLASGILVSSAFNGWCPFSSNCARR